MALELSVKKIRCNVILPGVVKTEMIEAMFETLPESSVNQIASQHPLGLGLPADVANLAVFLLSDNSRWITGSEIVIDGGYSAQ
jgi:NAD(P)-dependent dehydrogenase (short-subunit alcohol dehydrogenase family)